MQLVEDFGMESKGSGHENRSEKFICIHHPLVLLIDEADEGGGEQFEGVREPTLAGGLAW